MTDETKKPQEKQQTPPAEQTSKPNSNKNDVFQFVIAIIIIGSFLILLAWIYPNKQDDGIKMINMLEGFVGMIIGFYFGQRPIHNLTKQVEDVSSKRADLETKLDALEEKQSKTEKELLANISDNRALRETLEEIVIKNREENKGKEENKSPKNNLQNEEETK